MHRLKEAKPSPSMIVAIIALVAALSGSAYAASKITGKDIKNNAITSPKVKNKTLKTKDFSNQARKQLQGAQGPQGPKGDTGPQGPVGPSTPATYTNPNWSVIDRNTEGSAVGTLAGGPYFGTAAADGPPLGVGALHIETASGSEKVAFGNQVDFAGDPVSGLSQMGYSYTQTGEDYDRYAGNLPNISLEINPSVANKDYTSMVYVPPAPATKPEQKWFTTDADADPGGGASGWYFTNGSVAAATLCGQAGGQHFCSLTEAENALVTNNDGGPAASILTLGVAKGKDYQYQGSVDALRVNDEVFNFEPFGVEVTTP